MTADDLRKAVDGVPAADREEEHSAWILETAEAGSPFIGSRPGRVTGEPGQLTSRRPG
jgi:hypothetical protein